jgi:hypothetical protein
MSTASPAADDPIRASLCSCLVVVVAGTYVVAHFFHSMFLREGETEEIDDHYAPVPA